ncbi:MAG: putative LPS assembly protein LptD, partial [Cyclobacteriaceae bacterium]|nr:putative LPS assembly protein LptD [Cyclobacteriaceae bacterium]
MNAITLRKIVKFSSNRKKEVYNLERIATVLKQFIFLLFYLAFSFQLLAQEIEPLGDASKISTENKTQYSDSVLLLNDTIVVVNDTTQLPIPESDIETTINYSANDSIKFGMKNQTVYLFGKAVVDYGDIKLEAQEIEIDWSTNMITARGVEDSLGNKIGMPVFQNGSETYVTKGMKYNFDTGRAIIKEVVTQQGDGYMHGTEVFKNEDNELFSSDNSYTTCNLEVPHYSIKSKKTKAIPDDKIVSGFFNLEINEVPTPLGFVFGMFPMQKTSSSGIIMPTYGEERIRGFYLRNGGYFFDISEYFKIRLTGDIYTKGSSGLRLDIPYKKRYKYNGNLNFVFTKSNLSDKIENRGAKNDFQLRWNHSPQSKGNSRFSASVNAATSTFSENNVLSVTQNTNRKLSSTISYSKTFGKSPFSMGLNMRHNQDVATNQIDLTLPDLSVNMNNIYPFRGKSGSSKTWYQKMALRWSMNGTNKLTNNLGNIGTERQDSIAPFNGNTIPIFFDDSRKGFKHNIPLSTSFKVFKYFTLSPSVNYNERWYFDKLDWRYDDIDSAIVADTIAGFNRAYDYNGGVSLNTRVFGTYFFKKGSVQAIRHVMNPSISFNYSPDFSEEKYDFYQRIENPTNERNPVVYKSRHEGRNYMYGQPGAGESGSIGFSLTNNLEMKYHSKKDSTEEFRKIPLLNNFGLSSSYNIIADSFKLSPISLR